MNSTAWVSQPLTAEHSLAGFDCGVDALNGWLKGSAVRAQGWDQARTYVWTGPDSLAVVAYYAVVPTQVARVDLTSDQAKTSAAVPGYLLAKLALDRRLHGQGLGQQLLVDALEVIVRASDRSGGRVIVVDAIDEGAARFYEHHDFVRVKQTPHRLVMKVATARSALGLSTLALAADSSTGLVSMVLSRPDGSESTMVTGPARGR